MLLTYLEPVPFTIDNDAHLGLSETQGTLSCDGKNLVIEFQIADAIVGAWKGGMKRIEIPLSDLYRVEYRSRFFGLWNRLIIHSRRQDLLEGIPDAKQGRMTGIVKRADRSCADEFCLEVSTAIQRVRGEALEGELGRMELR